MTQELSVKSVYTGEEWEEVEESEAIFHPHKELILYCDGDSKIQFWSYAWDDLTLVKVIHLNHFCQ